MMVVASYLLKPHREKGLSRDR